MNEEELKNTIDIVSGIEVNSEAEAIAKETLISYVEQLKKYCCKRNDCGGRLKENNKLTDNEVLTEFEKWLEEEMKRKNSRWEQFHNQINTQELVLERLNAQIVFIDCCLKRIQELKEGKK